MLIDCKEFTILETSNIKGWDTDSQPPTHMLSMPEVFVHMYTPIRVCDHLLPQGNSRQFGPRNRPVHGTGVTWYLTHVVRYLQDVLQHRS